MNSEIIKFYLQISYILYKKLCLLMFNMVLIYIRDILDNEINFKVI